MTCETLKRLHIANRLRSGPVEEDRTWGDERTSETPPPSEKRARELEEAAKRHGYGGE